MPNVCGDPLESGKSPINRCCRWMKWGNHLWRVDYQRVNRWDFSWIIPRISMRQLIQQRSWGFNEFKGYASRWGALLSTGFPAAICCLSMCCSKLDAHLKGFRIQHWHFSVCLADTKSMSSCSCVFFLPCVGRVRFLGLYGKVCLGGGGRSAKKSQN